MKMLKKIEFLDLSIEDWEKVENEVFEGVEVKDDENEPVKENLDVGSKVWDGLKVGFNSIVFEGLIVFIIGLFERNLADLTKYVWWENFRVDVLEFRRDLLKCVVFEISLVVVNLIDGLKRSEFMNLSEIVYNFVRSNLKVFSVDSGMKIVVGFGVSLWHK